MNRMLRRNYERRGKKAARREAKNAQKELIGKSLVNCVFDGMPCKHPMASINPSNIGCEVAYSGTNEDEQVLWSCPRFPYSSINSISKRSGECG